MSKKKLQSVAKATPKRVVRCWLILSKKEEKFKDRIFLNDLFFKYRDNKLQKVPGEQFWMSLAERGIYLHPALEKQYRLQKTCFFCSGSIVTYKADNNNYEDRCSDCNYLYSES